MPILRVGPISVVRLLCVILFLSFPVISFSAYQVSAPFWVQKIDSAFFIRDAYFKSHLPDVSDFSLILLNSEQRQMLCDRMAAEKDSLSPWYHFVSGIIECKQGSTVMSTHFAAALALAKQDPGTTWALFVEFTRNRESVWAERCLMHLEKVFLASGACSAPSIAQQLLYYAHRHEREKEIAIAFSYYTWAERFDPYQIWSGLHRLRNCIPSHPHLFFTTLSDLVHKLGKSWQLQLGVLSHASDWLRICCMVYIIAVFAGLGFKYLPFAVHPIVDRLPDYIPMTIKTSIPVAALLSFVSLGLLPFLWLLAFCVWRFVDHNEKLLASAALVLLVLYPVEVRLQDMFIQARSPQSSLTLFSRASQEGYQSDLHQLTLKKIIINPSDALAHLAASLWASKQGDTAASHLNIRKSLELRNDDRVFLTFAGNLAYLAGDNNGAVAYYQQVLTTNPGDMVAQFNLAQCYSRNSDTTMDLDFMKVMTKNEQVRINDFINANNVYFSSNWPSFRKIMNPDYSVREFWFRLFPMSSGSWKTTRNLWGPAFFGLTPLLSLFAFIALFIALLVWGVTPSSRSIRAARSTCRLCKQVVCTQCIKGEICPSCSQETQFIRNVKTLAAIQSKIMRRQRFFRGLIAHTLDITLPGAGMLYAGSRGIIFVAPLLACTALTYATFLFLSEAQLNYPHWAAYGAMEKFPFFLFAYNGAFAIRAIFSLLHKKETVLV